MSRKNGKKRCDPARVSRARERAPRKLQNRYQKLCRDNPQAIVELWTMDEHRLGLKPIPNLPLGLHLEFLPPYSPELQPAERLWPIVDEPLANRSFTNLEQLEEILYTRCQVIWQQGGNRRFVQRSAACR